MLYGTGIGKAAAVLVVQKGAKIAISDWDKDKAEDVVNEIRGFQGEAESFRGNALDEEFPPRLVDMGKINCLINNAGFCHDSAIHKMGEDKFDIINKMHNDVPFRVTSVIRAYNVKSASGLSNSPISCSNNSPSLSTWQSEHLGPALNPVVSIASVSHCPPTIDGPNPDPTMDLTF